MPPLCEVPAGPFLMGDDKHNAIVSAFAIARYLVTVAEYACFVRTGYQPPQEDSYLHLTWEQQLLRLDHPIVNVSWQDATAYATWLAERMGQSWRLPTETEWEKAARGTDGWVYPWGDTFDKSRCNTYESGIKTTTPVGSYPSGASPYGVQDMAGNAWEWTDSRYDNSTGNRVLHGGSWGGGSRGACVACRLVNLPSIFLGRVGVRLVVASPETSPPTPFPKRKGP